MTLEELIKALGFGTEDTKDKTSILKKEFNSKVREINTLNTAVEKYKADATDAKTMADKFAIVTKAFNLDLNAKDIDAMLEERKEALVKEAGGGTTPEEIKTLKRDLAKAQRDRDANSEQIASLTEQLNAEKTQRISNAKRTAIHKALVDNHAIKPTMFVDMFLDKVTVDDDGETMTMKDEVGNELSINDAIADWAKNNPELIKEDIKGGTGSGSNGSGKNGSNGVSDFMKDLITGSNNSNGAGGGKSLTELFGR